MFNDVCFLFELKLDWLFTVLHPAQFFSLYGDPGMEISPLPVKGCKIKAYLGAQGLWAGRDLYRATPSIRHRASICPVSFERRLLRPARRCWGPIITQSLTGPYSVYLTTPNFMGENSCLFIATRAIFQLSGGYHHYRWFRPMLSNSTHGF
jgi:hypothetical protein